MQLVLIFLMVFIYNGFAYELEDGISARWSVLGGVAFATTPSSLYINPAGLIDIESNDFEFDFHAPFLENKAPVLNNKSISGETIVKSDMSFAYRHKLNEKFVIAAGFYPITSFESSFLQLKMTEVSTAPNSWDDIRPSIGSSLDVFDYLVGSGYRLNKNWSLGLCLRYTTIKSHLSYLLYNKSINPSHVSFVELSDLSGNNFGGLIFGGKFLSNSKLWGVGITIRSGFDYTLNGQSDGVEQNSFGTDQSDMDGGDVMVKGHSPSKFSSGMFLYLDPAKKNQLLTLTYTWINYSALSKLNLSGDKMIGMDSKDLINNRSINLDWHNQYKIKIGWEYRFPKYFLRSGYSFGTSIVPENMANPIFVSPGEVHSFYGGIGLQFRQKKINLDFAGKFTTITKENGKSEKFSDDEIGLTQLTGKYSTTDTSLMMSLKYSFD